MCMHARMRLAQVCLGVGRYFLNFQERIRFGGIIAIAHNEDFGLFSREDAGCRLRAGSLSAVFVCANALISSGILIGAILRLLHERYK